MTAPGQKRKSRHVQLRLLEGNEGFVQIADLTRSEGYRIGDPLPRAAADLGGIRTLLVVPLRKSGTVLGTFGGGARDKGPELRGERPQRVKSCPRGPEIQLPLFPRKMG